VGEAERAKLALAGPPGPISLVGQEDARAAGVAPLDDEALGLLARLQRPQRPVVVRLVDEPRRSRTRTRT
jgi:hypothetical protein